MNGEMNKYRDDFIHEANEHILAINKALIELEKSPDNLSIIQSLFVEVHTLKSMSATMNFNHLTKLCHEIETLFSEIKLKRIKVENAAGIIFTSCDLIISSLKNIENNKDEVNTKEMIDNIHRLLVNQNDISPSDVEIGDSSKHTIEKLRAVNVKVETLDGLMSLSEELLTNKIQLDMIEDEVSHSKLSLGLQHLGRLLNELQYLIIQTRLVPLEYIFKRFPRMVRDISKTLNKKIDLQMQGGSIEVDRSLLDELGECLVHLIRNAADHGIEPGLERKKAEKFEISIITISATQNRNSIMLSVSDDGRGLDIEQIEKEGIKSNLIQQNANEQEIINTIFSSLSTSASVSEISGRGVGLNVVKNKVEALGGSINVTSYPGKGATFDLEIPLTLAVIRVLFVTSGEKKYAIPIKYISRLLKINKDKIKNALDQEVIIFDEIEIPLVRLSVLFKDKRVEADKVSIILIQHKSNYCAIAVDGFSIMRDVVIKPVNSALKNNKYFSGTTIFGDGEVVLVLDIINLPFLKDYSNG